MSPQKCLRIGCSRTAYFGHDFCPTCQFDLSHPEQASSGPPILSRKYPQQYRSVAGLNEIDSFGICHLFNIDDPSGCLQQAVRTLLTSGMRGNGNSAVDDIREARDTLDRWLQLNEAPEAV